MLTFAYPIYLLLLLLLPAIWGLYVWCRSIRRRNLRRFGNKNVLLPLMPEVSKYKPAIRISLTLTALGLLVIAYARPWGGVTEQTTNREGIEVVAAIDASNSMLAPSTADDNGLSRLQAAKIMLEQMTQAMAGDRVGLVVYAGEAYNLIPVSSDYASVRTFLGTIDPAQIPSQGTDIAAAIRTAAASFSPGNKTGKAIVLITDAEELENPDEVIEAAKAARKAGIQIDVVGYGTSQGATIPTSRGLLTDEDGQVVTTRINIDLAKSIAKAGGGIFVNGDATDALAQLQKQLKEVKRSKLSSSTLVSHDELFMYFALLALMFMVVEACMVDRKNSLLARITFFKKDSAK